MRCSVAAVRSRRPWLLAAVSLLALGAAGCSSDTARFDSNPFASRNSGPSGDVTGSVQAQRPATVYAAPTSRVESRPLPQASSQPLPPPNRPYVSSAVPASTVSSSPGVTGGNRGLASYHPPAAGSDITGSVSAPPSAPSRAPQQANRSSNWDWDGGTAVTVGPGETAAVIAHRYGVPASALMQANGITDPNQVQTGRRLVIPRYNSAAAPAAPQQLPPPPAQTASNVRAAPVASTPPTMAAPANGAVHIVAPGENLIRIAYRYKKPLAEVAKANNLPPHAKVKIGDRIVIPGVRAASAPAQPRPLAAAPAPLKAPGPQLASVPPAAPAPKVMANAMPRNGAAESPHVARVVTPNESQPAAEPSATKTAEPGGFRWPVRGRIIAGYGSKTTGQQNDGINLAVPEGTPIKAAEDGVVAYAGNELKGYGNLVLVRHSNGYVTAYAHASELLVKRGDPIKRGQVIMRAGQTGNVSSPQLHFEIRKGSTPVDPAQYLSGA